MNIELRAHHIKILKEAVDYGPGRTAYTHALELHQSLTQHDNFRHFPDEVKEYYLDLVGTSAPQHEGWLALDQHEQQYSAHLKAALTTLATPTLGSLTFITQGKDELCACAINGAHCLSTSNRSIIDIPARELQIIQSLKILLGEALQIALNPLPCGIIDHSTLIKFLKRTPYKTIWQL